MASAKSPFADRENLSGIYPVHNVRYLSGSDRGGRTYVSDRDRAVDWSAPGLDVARYQVLDPVALRRAADRQRPHLVVHVQFRFWLPQPVAVQLGGDFQTGQ